MTSSNPATFPSPASDAWRWWEMRRPAYNITLAVGGWVAYGLAISIAYAFRQPLWQDWRGALGLTLFLGALYLVMMGAANVFYLLGAAVEGWVKPADVERYRNNGYRMGRWGSLIVPFTLPLLELALFIGKA